MEKRWSSKYWLLTYSQDIHLPKEESYEHFSKLHKNNVLDKCIICHEICPTTGKKHTHVLLCYNKRVDFTSPRHFDIGEYHPCIEKARSLGASERYLKKEDPEPFIKDNGKVLGGMNAEVDRIWNCETIQDALIGVKNLRDVPAVIAAFENKPDDEQEDIDIFDWYPWQLEIMKEMEQEITPAKGRRIIWIYDYKGGSGKTVLAEEMARRDPKHVLVVTETGSMRDFGSLIYTHYLEGWNGGTVFINFSRHKQDRDALYSPLEALSDRRITTLKYKGKSIRLKRRVRVIVLANWPPMVKDTISMDRWDIRQLKKDETGVLQCYSEDALDHVKKSLLEKK